MLDVQPGGRERRLIGIILVLAAVALTFVVIGYLASVFFYFGDILLTFFLAWLLAFIISPAVTRISALIPRLPRIVATVLVYTGVVAVLLVILIVVAGALATSISEFVASIPDWKRTSRTSSSRGRTGSHRSDSGRSICSPRRRHSSPISMT